MTKREPWSELHVRAAAGHVTTPWLRTMWSGKDGFDQLPAFTAHDQFSWSLRAHNEVNRRLGKPVLTVVQARTIWLKA